MAKKRKITGIARDIAFPMAFAGGAIGASVLGGAFQSKLPAGTANPLTKTGSTIGKFAGPVSAISSSGIILKQLNKTNKKFKRRY